MNDLNWFAFNKQVYENLHAMIGSKQYILLRDQYEHGMVNGKHGFHTFCDYLMAEHAELVAPAVAKARLLA